MVRTKEFDSTTETIGLGNNDTTENVDGRLEGVTERLQDEKTSTLQQLKESPNVTRITVRPRRPDPMPDLPRRSSSKTQKRTSGMESFGGSMTDSVRQDDERQHYYHSSRYETNFVRKVGDSYSPRPTRPSTAYGHFASVADRDTYRSPLPPRSTTSFGRFHTMDYAFRSPERRSPSRKPRFYFSYAPEAFRHEVIRPSRMELLSLEDQLARLKREKRRLGKQLSRYSSRVYPQPEDIYNGLLRLDQEIRVLEAKLNSLRGTR
ncbi:unnamed protein product [Dicrocoelium dendriticum]|nr:unnamed protein product [Dicrocoelium dendriticum]